MALEIIGGFGRAGASGWWALSASDKRPRRKLRKRKRQEEQKEAARAFGREAVWSVLIFGLLASLAGIVVMVVAGKPAYAVFFLPSSVLLGVALWKWEAHDNRVER